MKSWFGRVIDLERRWRVWGLYRLAWTTAVVMVLGVGTLISWFGRMIDLERRWRWRIWGLYLAAWTTALIAPVPETPGLNVEGFGPITPRMLIAKTLHVCAYALLAALTGWLRVAPPRRLWLLLLLTVHATATELIQVEVVYRTGQLSDVALDQIGIALGMLCSWRWWCAPAAER